MTNDEFKTLLKGRLSEKRYYHSLCVADCAEELAKKYGVTALPSFIVLKNGTEVDRFSGLHSKFDIMNIMTRHLK